MKQEDIKLLNFLEYLKNLPNNFLINEAIKFKIMELLEHTQGLNNAINPQSQKSMGAPDVYDNIKVEDFSND